MTRVNLLLLAALLASCLYLVKTAYESRRLFHALDRARSESAQLETDFCYVEDAAPLLAHLAALPSLRTLHRPANLEDVFLKLTGRELRD